MINVSLNGVRLCGRASVTIKRSITSGSAAWVNGRRLKSGETIEWDGVVIYQEPSSSLRDPSLQEFEASP